MSNPIADKLEAACSVAPFHVEKERYEMAAQEIRRLQDLVDQLTPPDTDPGVSVFYPGSPWRAEEDQDCVRIFRGELQIIKAPKHGTPYQEYWPEPELLVWILATLNHGEGARV